MKKFLFFSTLFFTFVFSSCSDVSEKESEYVLTDADRILYLTEKSNWLEEQYSDLKSQNEKMMEYLQKDPNYYLFVLDREIIAAKNGSMTTGSMTDYFLPIANDALENGASRSQVIERVKTLIDLGKQGKYYSSYLEEMLKEYGPEESLRIIIKDYLPEK